MGPGAWSLEPGEPWGLKAWGARGLEPGAWSLVPGEPGKAWRPGDWRPGAWRPGPTAWSLEPGELEAWRQEPGAWGLGSPWSLETWSLGGQAWSLGPGEPGEPGGRARTWSLEPVLCPSVCVCCLCRRHNFQGLQSGCLLDEAHPIRRQQRRDKVSEDAIGCTTDALLRTVLYQRSSSPALSLFNYYSITIPITLFNSSITTQNHYANQYEIGFNTSRKGWLRLH
jgi:hypothetical protein